MAKGGARVPSDSFSVGKGMGIKLHWILLREMENHGKRVTTDEIKDILNKKYAWWDDARNETCRSYLKELWRLGFLDKIDSRSKSIPITKNNWTYGSKISYYKLSQVYHNKKIGLNPENFPYCTSNLLIEAMNNGIFPQLEKMLNLEKKLGYIPVSDSQTAQLSKKYGIPIELHAGKAIKFGWLEPTGIIYRINKNRFKVNINWLNDITNNKYLPFENLQIGDQNIEILFEQKKLEISMNNDSKLHLPFEIKNKDTNDISIKMKVILSPIIEKRIVSYLTKDYNIKAGDSVKGTLTISYKGYDFSDSFMEIPLGRLKVDYDNKISYFLLPDIEIMNDDHRWELFLCNMLKQLGIRVFHLSGKSDRPDAVVDLSGLPSHPINLLGYLRDDSKEKLLMETTMGEYSGSKLEADTFKKNRRGLTKFETHTTKVLKIAAIGQLILADKFSKNINLKFNQYRNSCSHLITLIDLNTLKYLITKNTGRGINDSLRNVLSSREIVTRALIDKYYR